jgi:hypothetical protein
MKTGQTLLYTYTEQDGCLPEKVGQVRPAVVVRDWGGCANVQVLTDCSNDFEGGLPGSDGRLWLTSRSYSDEPRPGCLSPVVPAVVPVVPAPVTEQAPAAPSFADLVKKSATA